MGTTNIQWTANEDGTPGKTWNPLRGCTEISPGCAHCYAAVLAARFSGPGQPYEGLAHFDANHKAHWAGKVRLAETKLAEPLRWRKPARVFVNSMSDLFHEDVSNESIAAVFGVMAYCRRHTFQVLTKRADRMADWFRWWTKPGLDPATTALMDLGVKMPDDFIGVPEWPLPNVWLGVSVEDQKRADERIPHLLRCPAAVRFLSVEPMLGPVDLNRMETICETWRKGLTIGTYLDWVICGGESGPHARPFDLAWARSLRDQCKAAGVAFFMKQLGARPVGSWFPLGTPVTNERLDALPDRTFDPDIPCHWRLEDSHGGEESEWPEDLRGCRAFPRSEVAHVQG